jgi:membrane associated rhomboid family serine protease
MPLPRVARGWYHGYMSIVPDLRDRDPNRFGSEAFYAALGRAFVGMCAAVPVLFLIELVDTLTSHELVTDGGLRPRTLSGLDGVVFSPLLHGSFTHVTANSVPLILLGTFVLAAGTARFVWATLFIAVVGGLAEWFVGDPDTVVVGASGVIFGYLGLLAVRGLVERSWWNIAVAVLVALLYGWQLTGVLPSVESHVSWQGHLFGLISGMIAAVVFRRRRAPAVASGPGAAGPGTGVSGRPLDS